MHAEAAPVWGGILTKENTMTKKMYNELKEYAERGVQAFRQGNMLEACSCFTTIIELYPSLSCTYRVRGLCNMLLGNYEIAEYDFVDAIEKETRFFGCDALCYIYLQHNTLLHKQHDKPELLSKYDRAKLNAMIYRLK